MKLANQHKLVTEIFCCPKCRKSFTLLTDSELQCTSCAICYKNQEGIWVFMHSGDFSQQKEKELREAVAKEHEGKSESDILSRVRKHHAVSIMQEKAQKFRARFKDADWILDLGCGTGYYWQNTHSGGRLILTDFVFENLKIAKQLLGEDRALFVQADAAYLPFHDHSISGLWSVQVIQHFPENVMSVFQEVLKRVLAKHFYLEIYNLNPSLLHQLFYTIRGKKNWGWQVAGVPLKRFSSGELRTFAKQICPEAKIRIEYSELFFHPDFRFAFDNPLTKILEHYLSKFHLFARALARQIELVVTQI